MYKTQGILYTQSKLKAVLSNLVPLQVVFGNKILYSFLFRFRQHDKKHIEQHNDYNLNNTFDNSEIRASSANYHPIDTPAFSMLPVRHGGGKQRLHLCGLPKLREYPVSPCAPA